MPSRAGLAFCVTLLLLLVVSINYQLSLGFALTFLLAGSAAASMQMTHGSLRGLTLHLKPLVPAFDGDAAVLEVVVTNPGKSRLGVGFGLDLGARPIPLAYAEIAAQGQTVGAPELARAGPRPARAAGGARRVALSVRAVPRLDDLAPGRPAMGLSAARDADAAVAAGRGRAGRRQPAARTGTRHRVRRRARLPPRRHAAPGRLEEGGAHRRDDQPRDRRRRAARDVAAVGPGAGAGHRGAAVAPGRVGGRRRRRRPRAGACACPAPSWRPTTAAPHRHAALQALARW